MGSGFRTFASGEVLTAANVNNYLMEQAVMSFADGTARDAAITSPEEGMTAYLQDSNSITVYSGSAWVTIADLEVLIVDSTNGRVGVGTSSPDNPISIVTANTLGNTFTGTTDGEGLRVNQSTYTADDYVSLVEGSYADGNPPSVRIGAQYTSGGSRLSFGTTNSYASGITNEALTIDQSGYVGIGTVDPERTLEIHGASNPEVRIQSTDSSDPFLYFGDQVDAVRGGIGYDVSEDALLLRGYNNNTRMTIDSSGNVGINDTTPTYNFDVNGSEDIASRININSANTANRYVMRFSRNNSLFSSGIYCDTSQAYFGTPSDANLKTDIEQIPTADALATVNQLKPITYRFLTDPDDVVRRGFIAQEVEQVLPEAVHRVGQDDDIVLTWEPITTTAVAAVQELLSLVNTLTARIEVLESQ